jgi:hypothetical protein
MTKEQIAAELAAFNASRKPTRRERRLANLAKIREGYAPIAEELAARLAAAPIVISVMHEA